MRGWPVVLPSFLLGAALASGALSAAAENPVFEWDYVHDGGGQQYDCGIKTVTDMAGNLVIAGESTDLPGGVDLLIMKLDRQSGDTLWTVRYAAADDNDMAVGGMVWDGFGDLLIGGTRLGCFG